MESGPGGDQRTSMAGIPSANPSGAGVRGSQGSQATLLSIGSGTTIPSHTSLSLSRCLPVGGCLPLLSPLVMLWEGWGRTRAVLTHREAKCLSVQTVWGQTLHLGHLESQAAVNRWNRGASPTAAESRASQPRGLLITPASPMGLQGLDPQATRLSLRTHPTSDLAPRSPSPALSRPSCLSPNSRVDGNGAPGPIHSEGQARGGGAASLFSCPPQSRLPCNPTARVPPCPEPDFTGNTRRPSG